MPESIKFHLSGSLCPGVMSKDIILFIAGRYSTSVAQYKAAEFSGPTVTELSIESRMVISNMCVEIGGKFGLFEVDEKVTEYLSGRSDKPLEGIKADENADYEKTAHYSIREESGGFD